MIDVGGHVIAPGFIDIHSHCDFILPLPDQGDFLEPFVRQGITTLVIGNCGYAPAPINPATAPLMRRTPPSSNRATLSGTGGRSASTSITSSNTASS